MMGMITTVMAMRMMMVMMRMMMSMMTTTVTVTVMLMVTCTFTHLVVPCTLLPMTLAIILFTLHSLSC